MSKNTQFDQSISSFAKAVVTTETLWLLTDEHGCMMLNSEDEDCVPVWSEQVLADAWINGEWQSCKAEAVTINDWLNRWVPGLVDDDLAVVVNPDQQAMGIVLLPDELAYEIERCRKKRTK
ncbi:DUF2750 domain-containing protein [Thalassotalea sp. G2M2-11]|uniref:DUF2750 domain-containing protein n=1 Tax=Thalassotalea sp. G2M2-11 TaxID=2787627 RepID=UPI0019D31174|nr:DUF2750 domain-containing protein [Thalassotalea sp. G2M2-11]